jgi:hypothetical protein
MIANPLVNHRLSWWSYPVLLATLAMLPCLPSFTQAQDHVRTELAIDYGFSPDLEIVNFGDPLDPYSSWVVVEPLTSHDLAPHMQRITVKFPGQTDRRAYTYHRSKLGVVVLAFELKSRKLAWSSEIELPADGKAAAGQQFLLHTGGGVVTIAVVQDENSLKIQELDAETGNATAECRLTRPARDRFWGAAREVDPKSNARIEELLQQQKALQERLTREERQRKAIEADLKAAAEKLRNLLDEQLTRVAEGALRGQDDPPAGRPDRLLLEGLRQAKQLDDLVIELAAVTDARLTVETAGTVWRLVNGDAPIESIRMVREGGKDRMIIEGKAKKHRRIILEIRSADDKSDSDENEAELPPGGASTREDQGASTQRSTTDPLVQNAVQYLSRRQAGPPVDGFDYQPSE